MNNSTYFIEANTTINMGSSEVVEEFERVVLSASSDTDAIKQFMVKEAYDDEMAEEEVTGDYMKFMDLGGDREITITKVEELTSDLDTSVLKKYLTCF